MKDSSRADKIKAHRQSQPIEVLEKRAAMARRRPRLWTQEELDVAEIKGMLRYAMYTNKKEIE